MKKVMSIAIAAITLLCVLALAGCQSAPAATPTQAPTEDQPQNAIADATPGEEQPVAAEGKLPEGIKIGATFLVNDGLFADMYKYHQYMADTLGYELVVDIGAFSPEEQVASIENLIAAGCQGIVFCNFSEACLPKIASICDEAEVYWSMYCRQIDDPDTKAVVDGSKYYVGRASEDNAKVGVMVADTFNGYGVKNVAIVGPQTGDTTTDTISDSFKSAAQGYGMTVLAEVRNVDDAATATAAVENIMANFPEVEGICVLSGSTGKFEGVMQGLENTGYKGKVYVGGNDSSASLISDLESGNVSCCTSGQFVDHIYNATMVLNAVMGTPLTEGGEKIDLSCNYLEFTTADQARMFFETMMDHDSHSYPYDIDEIRSMIKYFNPDFTYADLQAIAAAYSFEDFTARHG